MNTIGRRAVYTYKTVVHASGTNGEFKGQGVAGTTSIALRGNDRNFGLLAQFICQVAYTGGFIAIIVTNQDVHSELLVIDSLVLLVDGHENCFTILENPEILTMSKKPGDHDDKSLFKEMMNEVRPLPQDKVGPYRKKPPARPIKRQEEDNQVLKDMMSDPITLDDLETGEELLFSRPGIQTNVVRKLRRGQYSIEAELDLHRMTSNMARQAIAEFLPEMLKRGKRCVRIIHGKGHGSFNKVPVLKNKVNHWLKQRDEVLAFCSARPVDGGTGAIYILLRRITP